MKYLFQLLLFLFISILAGGIYGIIHDQITFTISPEYYTQFKFEQFGISDYMWDRWGLVVVGWNATWWFGLILGIILGISGMIKAKGQNFLIIGIRAIGLNMGIALVVGFIGLAIAYLFFDPQSSNWIIPPEVIQKHDYLAVGSMHTFGYIGGILGLIAGIYYQWKIEKS